MLRKSRGIYFTAGGWNQELGITAEERAEHARANLEAEERIAKEAEPFLRVVRAEKASLSERIEAAKEYGRIAGKFHVG